REIHRAVGIKATDRAANVIVFLKTKVDATPECVGAADKAQVVYDLIGCDLTQVVDGRRRIKRIAREIQNERWIGIRIRIGVSEAEAKLVHPHYELVRYSAGRRPAIINRHILWSA